MELLNGIYQSHPAADLFPMMSEQELADLAADILAHGLQQPIAMLDGQVLDGRNRLVACVRGGVAPDFIDVDLGDQSPAEWVISRNLHRRHLTESQRAIIAVRAKEVFGVEARARQVAGLKRGEEKPVAANLRQPIGPDDRSSRSAAKAAVALGVSPRSVEHAATVVREGAPELIDAVEQGRASVSAAAQVAKALPKDRQAELARQGKAAVAEAASQLRRSKQPDPPMSPEPEPTDDEDDFEVFDPDKVRAPREVQVFLNRIMTAVAYSDEQCAGLARAAVACLCSPCQETEDEFADLLRQCEQPPPFDPDVASAAMFSAISRARTSWPRDVALGQLIDAIQQGLADVEIAAKERADV